MQSTGCSGGGDGMRTPEEIKKVLASVGERKKRVGKAFCIVYGPDLVEECCEAAVEYIKTLEKTVVETREQARQTAETATFCMANIARPVKRVKQEWISVKDRLPDDEKEVLCWYLSGDGNCYHTIGVCLQETYGNVWSTEADRDECGYGCEKVTHWMPLPEPPKEG